MLSNFLLFTLFYASFLCNALKQKYCVNCRFFIKNINYQGIEDDDPLFGKCSLFPIRNDYEYSNFLVSGIKQLETPQEYRHCSTARCFDDMCGEKASLYKPIPKIIIVNPQE